MSVTHESCTRNLIANTVCSLLGASGYLELQTTSTVEVATLNFASTAFSTAVAGVATANSITADTNATGGTMAQASFLTSGAVRIMTCTVSSTGGTGDIKFNSVVVSAGQQVSITSLSYTAPT